MSTPMPAYTAPPTCAVAVPSTSGAPISTETVAVGAVPSMTSSSRAPTRVPTRNETTCSPEASGSFTRPSATR